MGQVNQRTKLTREDLVRLGTGTGQSPRSDSHESSIGTELQGQILLTLTTYLLSCRIWL
jgi:hypothetical protein